MASLSSTPDIARRSISERCVGHNMMQYRFKWYGFTSKWQTFRSRAIAHELIKKQQPLCNGLLQCYIGFKRTFWQYSARYYSLNTDYIFLWTVYWKHDDVIECFRVTGHLDGEFPTQWPVTGSFYVFFDLRPNERLSKHSRGWWLETQSSALWRHSNEDN